MLIRMGAVGFVLVLLVATVTSQTLEDGWSGIKPLMTKKSEVEKKLGIAKSDSSGYYYDLGNGIVVRLNYSSTPCTPVHYERAKYRIPKDTVLDYVVYFNDPTLFSNLRFNRADYTRRVSDHRPTEFVLVNAKAGVMIVGYYRQDIVGEYVGTIYFKPSSRLKEKLRCKS